jgi:hypothetical protein
VTAISPFALAALRAVVAAGSGYIDVLFNSSFRYDGADNISCATVDGQKTFCGRRVADAATTEPDDNDLDPDCITCRNAARKRRATGAP